MDTVHLATLAVASDLQVGSLFKTFTNRQILREKLRTLWTLSYCFFFYVFYISTFVLELVLDIK